MVAILCQSYDCVIISFIFYFFRLKTSRIKEGLILSYSLNFKLKKKHETIYLNKQSILVLVQNIDQLHLS